MSKEISTVTPDLIIANAIAEQVVAATAAPEKLTFMQIVDQLDLLFQVQERAKTKEEFDAAEEEITKLVGQPLPGKIEGYNYYDRKADGEISAIQNTEKILKARKKNIKARKDRMRQILMWGMKKLNVDELRGLSVNISIQDAKKSLNVFNPTMVPKQYWIPQPAILDKDAIRADLEKNILVPGAELVAGDDFLKFNPTARVAKDSNDDESED